MNRFVLCLSSFLCLITACNTYHGPKLPPHQQGMPDQSLDKVKEAIQKKPTGQDDTVGVSKKEKTEVFLDTLPYPRKHFSDSGITTLTS